MPGDNASSVTIYTTSSLINIFNNALSVDVTKKLFRIKGIYILGKGIAYNGYYYDVLKDETTDACITLIIPGVLRNGLQLNRIIECEAYLTRKVQVVNARIELQVNLVRALNQTETLINSEQREAV